MPKPTPASSLAVENTTHAETSDDNLTPVLVEHVNPHADQVSMLTKYLAENFPDEVALSNRQRPETPVETAIRLLTGMHAHSANPDMMRQRCTEAFCNLPVNHADSHRWVHYQ